MRLNGDVFWFLMPDSSSYASALRSVCVYCGSSESTRPEYHDLAVRVGRELARRKLRLIYGGGAIGLMGRCALAAHQDGGEVLGVMPRFLEQREIVLTAVPHRMVDTMHERKLIMFNEADAFIVLPGGIGTLEEAVEMLSWRRLGLHAKPVVFLAEDDFWSPFFHLIEHTIDANLTPAGFRDAVLNTHSLEDCFAALAQYAAA
jgi:uncharacterized protein (TIGR00730 family)